MKLYQTYKHNDTRQRDKYRKVCVQRLQRTYERNNRQQRNFYRRLCILQLQQFNKRKLSWNDGPVEKNS